MKTIYIKFGIYALVNKSDNFVFYFLNQEIYVYNKRIISFRGKALILGRLTAQVAHLDLVFEWFLFCSTMWSYSPRCRRE